MWSDRMVLVMFVCNYIIHILPYYAAATCTPLDTLCRHFDTLLGQVILGMFGNLPDD